MKRTTALIATLLALVVVSLPSVASAASLNVRGAVLTTVTARGCDDAIVITPRKDQRGDGTEASEGYDEVGTGSTKKFEARGLAPSCAGKEIKATLVGANGAALATLEGTATGRGTVDLGATTAVFLPDVRGAAAVVGSWGVATTWELPVEVLPRVICQTSDGGECTAREDEVRTASLELSRGSLFDLFRKDRLWINMSHEYWRGRTRLTVQGGTGGVDIVGWSCASNVLELKVKNGYLAVPVTVTAYTASSSPAGARSCSAP